MEFIASLVSSLAWPILIVVALLLYGKPLKRLLASSSPGRAIKRLKAGPVEMEWEATLEDAADRVAKVEESDPERHAIASPVGTLEEDLLQLAELAPNAAVMVAYQRVESALKQAVEAHPGFVPPKNRPLRAYNVVRAAAELDIIPKPMAEAISDLRRLRNVVTHEDYKVDISQAVGYVNTALLVLLVLSDERKPGIESDPE